MLVKYHSQNEHWPHTELPDGDILWFCNDIILLHCKMINTAPAIEVFY
jgi:hypothetical protein